MATDLPTVSVVTPSFNQGAFIDATIRSVIEQREAVAEYIVMDGGSTDGTLEILRRYAEELPGWFSFASGPDHGQADALNKAIAKTNGQIIGWLNSDDTYAPGAVGDAAAFLRLHPDIDLVYGHADFIDPDGAFIGRCAHVEPFDRKRLVHYTDFIVQPAAFFTRRAFDAVGGADESLHYTMDYDLFLKISDRFKVAHVPRHWANFRWFGGNKSATCGWDRMDEIRRITQPFGGRGLPAYMRIEGAFLDARLAWRDLQRGRPVPAVRSLAHGIGQIAPSPRTWKSLCSPACWRVMRTGLTLRRATNRLATACRAGNVW